MSLDTSTPPAQVVTTPEELTKKFFLFQKELQDLLNKYVLPYPMVLGTLRCHQVVLEAQLVDSARYSQATEAILESQKEEAMKKGAIQ
jgi:hypothetical protein